MKFTLKNWHIITDWGWFLYCDNAVQDDIDAGLEVVEECDIIPGCEVMAGGRWLMVEDVQPSNNSRRFYFSGMDQDGGFSPENDEFWTISGKLGFLPGFSPNAWSTLKWVYTVILPEAD